MTLVSAISAFSASEKLFRNSPLRPDFFLPNYNLVIEFDGIQHFEPIEFFGGQEGFEKRQQKDREKNEYCKNNNIDILRIPYWDFNNIEKIIKNKLKINSSLLIVHSLTLILL